MQGNYFDVIPATAAVEALHILQENKFAARAKFCLEKSFVDENYLPYNKFFNQIVRFIRIFQLKLKIIHYILNAAKGSR